MYRTHSLRFHQIVYDHGYYKSLACFQQIRGATVSKELQSLIHTMHVHLRLRLRLRQIATLRL